ncbi:MAG: DUF1499 domain-containing protein [Isosphaeraceae bacterium]
MKLSRTKRSSFALLLLAGIVVTIRNLPARPPENLGVRNGRLLDCPDSPNCVCSDASEPSHRIEPLRFAGEPREALARLKKTIAAIPRLKIVSETENYLRVEASSLVFRFVDDVEFLIDPVARVICIRSASRVGHSDFGVNRRRIERIRSKYEMRDG